MTEKNFSQIKVPNGKLLQLQKINNHYRITGDFFCHPEEIITELENLLLRLDSSDSHDEIHEFFMNPNHTIIGFKHEDLLNLYKNVNA